MEKQVVKPKNLIRSVKLKNINLRNKLKEVNNKVKLISEDLSVEKWKNHKLNDEVEIRRGELEKLKNRINDVLVKNNLTDVRCNPVQISKSNVPKNIDVVEHLKYESAAKLSDWLVDNDFVNMKMFREDEYSRYYEVSINILAEKD